jgi:alpha,alpha-trehalose phosphorylase
VVVQERVEDRAPPAWVSVTHRAVAAIAYEVESVDAETRVVLQPELVANEQLPPVARDPRVSAALESPLRPEE